MRLKKHFITLMVCLITFAASAQQGDYKVKGYNYTWFTEANVQYLPDSIRIEFPQQHAIVLFQMKNITKNASHITQFPEKLRLYLKEIEGSIPGTAEPRTVTINVRKTGDHETTISHEAKGVTRISIAGNSITELLVPGWEINISAPGEKVYVYAPTFKELQALSLQSFQPEANKLTAEMEKLPLHRHSLLSRIVAQNDTVTYSKMTRRGVGDFLDLTGQAGFGFLNNRFYPELNLTMSVRFSDRINRNNHRVSLSYNNQFFAERMLDGKFRSNANSFLTLAWSKNINTKKTSPVWIGVGAGILIHREGDMYQRKTAKFMIHTSIEHFVLSPELYLTNDVKNFASGFKVAYNF